MNYRLVMKAAYLFSAVSNPAPIRDPCPRMGERAIEKNPFNALIFFASPDDRCRKRNT